jgi:hypothetical protein
MRARSVNSLIGGFLRDRWLTSAVLRAQITRKIAIFA